jgi:hypothetical protein
MVRTLVGIAMCGVALLSAGKARAAEPATSPSAVAPAPRAETTRASSSVTSSGSPPSARTITYDRNLPLKIGALVAGTSFLAISYGVPCAKAGGHWCIPYGGPIIAAVKYNERENANADDDSDEGGMIPPLFVDTLLVGVSAVQLLSTGLIVVGILIPRRDVTEPAYGFQLNRHVALTPVAAPSTVGLVASGNF